MPARESVVLVNGLWLPRLALEWQAHRLRRAGFDVHAFSYPSVSASLQANADRLQEFLAHLPGETVHLVGYSLGGLVVRALFHFHPGQRPGRVVLLGSPQQGSRAALALARWPWGRRLVGRSLAELNAGIPQQWPWPMRATGVIAGTRPWGLGRLVTSLPAPHDGTVSRMETELPEAHDRLALPISHAAFLLAPAVARQVSAFLRTGRFEQ